MDDISIYFYENINYLLFLFVYVNNYLYFCIVFNITTMKKRFVLSLIFTLCLSSLSWARVPEVILQSGFPYEDSTYQDFEYDVSQYTIELPHFEYYFYDKMSSFAHSRHFVVREWYGTINGVVYNNRGSFFSALHQQPEIVDVYERFIYTRDKRYFAELCYTENQLVFTFYADAKPYLYRKFSNVHFWFKTSFLRRLAH